MKRGKLMLKKGLMFGVVAIMILVAISITMGSEDSEAGANVDNNHKNCTVGFVPVTYITTIYIALSV